MSTKLAPLYELLHSGAGVRAFQSSNRLLASAPVLVHFDPDRELSLECDASAYDVGAVLSQTMPDGHNRPVGFVSRTLSAAEKNYSQMEKEGLGGEAIPFVSSRSALLAHDGS